MKERGQNQTVILLYAPFDAWVAFCREYGTARAVSQLGGHKYTGPLLVYNTRYKAAACFG